MTKKLMFIKEGVKNVFFGKFSLPNGPLLDTFGKLFDTFR